jgi:hypothetical protein
MIQHIEFRNEFWLNTTPNPLCRDEGIWRMAVAFRLMVPWNQGQCFIRSIRALERGRGDGSRGLAWLCDLADRHKLKLYCTVEPFGLKPRLNKYQLKRWYRRYGFVPTGDAKDEIMREPK